MKKGTHHSKETCKKLREHRLGKKLSNQHREKVVKTLRQGAGEKNAAWKGGKYTSKEGYVFVRQPLHPLARGNGYVAEHRLVMEEILGRILERCEVVHHINGIKSDNRPDNLIVLTHQTHAAEHWDNPDTRKKQSDMMKKIRKKKPWSTKKK